MVDQNKKILVVDDDVRLRELLQRYLTEQGFTVKVASDAKEMDVVLAAEPIDLLVLDLMLPGEDGLSICRRIRGSSTLLPIVMLTARGDEVDRIIGLEMGADDYLPKPFNPRELLARINAVMRRHERLQPSAPAANTDSEQDKAIAELRARVTALAIERAEAQLKDLLTASAQTELVDRSIAMVGGK